MKWLAVAAALLVTAGNASAQSSRLVAAIPVVRKWVTFSDPQENAFQVEVPQGWKDIGGTRRWNALQYRAWATALSPDGATILSVGDPNELSYATPMYGFRPGSVYDGGGGTRYIVDPLQSAQQYAVTWGTRKLRAFCTAIKVAGSRSRPDMTQQISSLSRAMGVRHDYGEATFTCERNGVELSGYAFLGVTLIRTSPQGGLWYADSITSFLAPAPVAGVAAGLLAHMIKSFRPNPLWLARQSQTAVNVSQIAAQTNAAISNSIMEGWKERGATMDRVMEEGSRTRLGIDIYADPATGNQYTVCNDSNFYWANPSGTVVGTQTDTAPKGFSRLNRVPP